MCSDRDEAKRLGDRPDFADWREEVTAALGGRAGHTTVASGPPAGKDNAGDPSLRRGWWYRLRRIRL